MACTEASGSTRHAYRRDAAAGYGVLPSPWSACLPVCTVRREDGVPGTERGFSSIRRSRTSYALPCRGCTDRTAGSQVSCAPRSTVLPSAWGSRGNCTVVWVYVAMPFTSGIEKAHGRFALPRAASIFHSLLL